MVCCQAASYGSAIVFFLKEFTMTELVERRISLQETRSVGVGIASRMIRWTHSDVDGLEKVRVDFRLRSDCVYAG